jgi:hypothetical protein
MFNAPAPASDPTPAADLEITTDKARPGDWRYTLRRQEASSERYGPCEVCGGYCEVVYSQSAEQRFSYHGDLSLVLRFRQFGGWAHKGSAFGHRECLEGLRRTRQVEPGDYRLIGRWLAGYLLDDLERRSAWLVQQFPSHSEAWARAVAGASLVLGWSDERELLECDVEASARAGSLPDDLEAFYTQVYEAEETPSPRGGSGYVNDVIDLSGNRAIWEDVDTLRAGRMP